MNNNPISNTQKVSIFLDKLLHVKINENSTATKLAFLLDKLSYQEIKFVASEIGLPPPPAPVIPYGSKIVENNSSVNMTLAHKWLSVFRTLSPETALILKSKLNPFNVSTTTPPPPPSRQYTHPLNKKRTRKTSRHHRKTHKNKRK